MWALATCRASIFRGTVPDPDYGNPVPDNTTPLYTNVLACIEEDTSRVWDPATQTPRVVRTVKAQVPSTADVLIGDRLRDDTNDQLWLVQNVSRPHATGGRKPDAELELKRVGTDEGER